MYPERDESEVLNIILLLFSTNIFGFILENVCIPDPVVDVIATTIGGFDVAFSKESHKLKVLSSITLTK